MTPRSTPHINHRGPPDGATNALEWTITVKIKTPEIGTDQSDSWRSSGKCLGPNLMKALLI